MATIFILPKQEELIGLTTNNSNENFKIISPCNNLIVDDPNGELDKILTAKNIIAEINKLNSKGESYLLYHIGNSKDLDIELKTENKNLNIRLYSSTDGEVIHTKIKLLIKEICEGKISISVEDMIKNFFYDKELEAKLELLHICLTPDGAKEAKNIPNYHLIKSIVDNVKFDGNETIIEYLSRQTDCHDKDNYIEPLTKLSKALLAS